MRISHQAWKRLPAAPTDTVVLCIHGILGSPNHFRDFLERIPARYAVYSILLDGHGGTVEDFSHSSMSAWKKQVRCVMKHLTQRYAHIIILAHSMGTLFAMQAAIAYPQSVTQLFLLGTALRPHITFRTVHESWRIMMHKVAANDLRTRVFQASTSIAFLPHPLYYIKWLPHYLALFREMKYTRKLLPQLRVPCITVQSGKDELVSKRAYRDLGCNPCIRRCILPDSNHAYYSPKDKSLMLALFSQIFEEA